MSLRSKAGNIRTHANDTRGVITAHGVPLRIYNYWRDNTLDNVGQENLCHFVRVILFWAPLMWLGGVIRRYRTALTAMAIAVGATAIVMCSMWWSDFALALLWLAIVLFVLTCAIGSGMLIKRYVPRVTSALLLKLTTYMSVGLLLALTVAWLVLGVIEYGWLFLAVFIGAVAMFGTVVALSIWLSYRAEKKELLRTVRDHEYFEQHGELPPVADSNTNLVKRFFTGIGAFIVIIFEYVRASKLKVCPFVKVDQ